MIDIKQDSIFHLYTRNTSYVFALLPTMLLEHVYYGRRLRDPFFSLSAIKEKHILAPGRSTKANKDYEISESDTLLELSREGKGDYRTPSIAISFGKYGERTLELKYIGYKKQDGIVRFRGPVMPQALGSELDASTLEIFYKDEESGIKVIDYYTVFEKADVITRRRAVINEGSEDIILRALSSGTIDFRVNSFRLHTFQGTYLRESHEVITEVKEGTYITESRHLSSGPDANPGFILENEEGAYGFNLIYSGAHRESIAQTVFGLTHVVWGINPDMFSWKLKKDELFEAPEAVMMFSPTVSGLSEISHSFIENHIRRGLWKNRMKPLMFNTKESMGYSVNEKTISLAARKAKELGFEGLLIDDGWFGARRNDRTSLGDWYANTMKFPSGLVATANEIHINGLLFGLFIEPEAISVHSELYRRHPDWAIGRNADKNAFSHYEELLDLTREDVQNWVIDTINNLVYIAKIDYLKLDITRLSSDLYSNKAERDYGSFAHQYMLGLYRILDSITKKNPQLYIESSASGGSRFDLGMLSYSAAISASENSDAYGRMKTIEGLVRLYPLSVIAVTITPSPNKMSGRIIDDETRFNASVFSALSYSIDISKMERDAEKRLISQLDFYKAYRPLLQLGSISTEEDGERTIWTVYNSDRSTMIILYFQRLRELNTTAEKIRIKEANESYDYQFFARDHYKSEVEELLFPQEPECYNISGDSLKWAGISLIEKLSGTGSKDGMRNLPDFSSRLYIIKKVVEN